MNKKFGDKIKTSYDAIADVWHEKREWYIEQASIDKAIAHLSHGAKILDVGCGSGKPIAAYLIEKGSDVTVIDEHTIEGSMFGERFYHSGNPAIKNTELIHSAGFEIISDIIDQPGNQVILAKKI